MKEADIKVVGQFKSLISSRVSVQELRIFGSRARGDAGDYSDLDILVNEVNDEANA